MRIQLYSYKPLSQEARLHFQLPHNPYDINVDTGIKYLEELSVFYYRDEEHGSEGVIVDNDVCNKPAGFPAYRSMGVLNKKGSIRDWPKPKTRAQRKEQSEKQAKEGDLRAWLMWNKQVVIVEINFNSVTLA